MEGFTHHFPMQEVGRLPGDAPAPTPVECIRIELDRARIAPESRQNGARIVLDRAGIVLDRARILLNCPRIVLVLVGSQIPGVAHGS